MENTSELEAQFIGKQKKLEVKMRKSICAAALVFAGAVFGGWGAGYTSFFDKADGIEVRYMKNPEDGERKIGIEVRRNGTEIQKIDYEYAEGFFDGSVFPFERHIEFEDLNFDGFKDIRIYLGRYGNQGVSYWSFFLWNGRESAFEYVGCEYIPNPAPNAEKKCLTSYERDNAVHHIYSIYEFIGDEFVLTHQFHEAPLSELYDVYGIELPDGADRGEYIVKHFGFPPEKADEIFYAEIRYSPDGTVSSAEKPSLSPSRLFCDAFRVKAENAGSR